MSGYRTFLSAFIVEKASSYGAPVRVGRRKGELIGFSREKYAACLWELYAFQGPLTQLAKRLGTTVSSIHTWRTRRDYQRRVENFVTEFSSRLVEFIEAEYRDLLQRWAEFYARPASDIWAADNYPSVSQEFLQQLVDAHVYSSKLKRSILRWICNEVRKAKASEADDTLPRLSFLDLVFSRFMSGALGKADLRATEEMLRTLANHLLDDVAKTLGKTNPSESERLQATVALLIVRKEFERLQSAAKAPRKARRGRRK